MKLDLFEQSEASFSDLVNSLNEPVNLTVSQAAQAKAAARVAKWIASKQAWQVTKSVTGVGQIVFCLKSKKAANEATAWLDNYADLSCIREKSELNELTRELRQRFNQHNLSC